jgi:hypothetical protein
MSITTLEEVFLKIGHGEEDSKQSTIAKLSKNTANLSRLTKREIQLSEYSVAKESAKSFS